MKKDVGGDANRKQFRIRPVKVERKPINDCLPLFLDGMRTYGLIETVTGDEHDGWIQYHNFIPHYYDEFGQEIHNALNFTKRDKDHDWDQAKT